MKQATTNIRVVGSGHSFVPLCATDDLLVSLDNLQGIVSIDAAQLEATIWAGAKLYQLGKPLLDAGFALENMGDIDRQSLAGAIATGTHGTGLGLGNMSTQITCIRLITAEGELVEIDAEKDPNRFNAARLSMGMLGVVTQITLRLLRAYRLHERTWIESFDECMHKLDEHVAATRHFEFFWSPTEDACACKALQPTDRTTPDLKDDIEPVDDRLRRYVGKERIDHSYRIFPSDRNLLFNEMEFAVPEAAGPACLKEIRGLMLERFPQVRWPIEYRTLAADEIWLSPAYQRDSVTISIHQAAELPFYDFFAAAETIFRSFDGRPHWGKMHFHSTKELAALYPRWESFQEVRLQMDPNGQF